MGCHVCPSVYLIYVHNYHNDDCDDMNIYVCVLLIIVGVYFRCGLVVVQ
jgi:hypothetical protein